MGGRRSNHSTVTGALFIGAGAKVNTIVAKLREDGRLSHRDPRTVSGFGADGVVGIAVAPAKSGWVAVADSADGCQGIGGTGFSRPGLISNHLGVDAIWYRRYTSDIALGVRFSGSSSRFDAVAASAGEVEAWLADAGVDSSAALAPKDSGEDATLIAIEYEEDDYRSGPDLDVVSRLLRISDALALGDGHALLERTAGIANDDKNLALGVIRAHRSGEFKRALTTAGALLVERPVEYRVVANELSVAEEILRLAVPLVPADKRLAIVDRLDEIETDASARSSFAFATGVVGIGYQYEASDPAFAYQCYRRALVRNDEPDYTLVVKVLYALLVSREGPIALDDEVADIAARIEKRAHDLGQEAADAARYNLACLYARAGDSARALATLKKTSNPKVINSEPEKDTDLEPLWGNPEFISFLALTPHQRGLARSVSELEIDEETAELLAERGIKTVAEIVAMEEPNKLPLMIRSDLSWALEQIDVEWDPDDDEEYEPPADRAIRRVDIEFEPTDDNSALVSRLGGLPNAPEASSPWPESRARPMALVVQLVGKAAGGDIDLGDITVLQVFADLEGEYYEANEVVIFRAPCPATLEPPAGVDVEDAQRFVLTEGADDRVLLDVDFPDDDDPLAEDHEKASSHAWEDKLWGIPTGANLDPDQRDAKGRPMKCLLQLVTYDDWFLWYVFVAEDFSEARVVVVRG